MIISLFDALGIQDYLFCSNRLQDNVGASSIVQDALRQWPVEAITDAQLSDDCLVLCGGGNGMFFFDSIEDARKMACAYSKILQERAPGLQVVCHHHDAGAAENLAQELEKAFQGLVGVKAVRTTGVPLAGLGVSQSCDTGRQEAAIDAQPSGSGLRFLGPSALAKTTHVDRAREKLEEIFISSEFIGCRFPIEFDQLGRSLGEKSFVGIVHLDGNSIGKKFQSIIQSATDKPTFRKEYLELSTKISQAGEYALQSAMVLLMANGNVDPGCGICSSFSLKHDQDGACLLPFRPLVFGGDDITFVCDGRIALDLTAQCMRSFHEKSGFHACAGIALVKSHYPFSRGYELAEQLCRNAKNYLKNGGIEGSAMDWHFLAGGPAVPIDEIRDRELMAKIGGRNYTLTCRPYLVDPVDSSSLKDWQSFRDKLLLPLQTGEEFQQAHSRLKKLPKILRQGPAAVEAILKEWQKNGLSLPGYSAFQGGNGFPDGSSTPYLDAIELLDFMVPLK